MQQWEYKIVLMDEYGYYADRPYTRDEWNWRTGAKGGHTEIAALGADGWELVSVGAWTPAQTVRNDPSPTNGDRAIAVFKRPKQP